MTIWTADELLRQIELGEDSRLELKEATVRGRKVTAPGRKMLADELAAPYNAQRLALPEGGGVLLIEVERSPHVHKGPGGYLTRQGSSTRELSAEALQRLFQR